jgi:thioredoxin 1
MSETTTKVSDATFEADVLRSSRPVLVDFWAEWCGPCKMIGPSLEELAKEYGEKVTIAKVNIDESPSVASRYNVRSIPALMVFKGGQVAASRIGAMPKNKIKEWVDSVI